jgi:hypothetical protein
MMKKEEDCEKLEQEVVSLRKSLRNSQVIKDLTHLGCMGETSYKEYANTNKKVEERATQTVDEKWTRIPERRNDYKRDEYPRRPPTFRNQRSFNQYEGNYIRVDHEPDGLHHKEGHLLQGIKISFLVIVILAKNLDIRKLIAESMKGTNMQET